MIVLDTNVVSALMRPALHGRVVDWLNRQPPESIWTTAPTVLEIRSGLLRLPAGRRRTEMSTAFDAVITELVERVLPFDTAAAEASAIEAARRITAGITIETLDTQIGGICIARRATLATRNIRHFDDLGIPLIDPWNA